MKFILSSAVFAATVGALPNSFTTLTATGGLVVPRANQLIPVVVGGPQDTFAPNSIVAAVGDVIQFQFSNGNHTATQSTIEAPCTPLAGGMSSGHIPFVDGQTDVGTFNMPVLTTEPMLIYCATGPHCQTGQVMIINPANAAQVVAFVKAAQASAPSVDSDLITAGTVGKLPLGNAAFTPDKPQGGGATGGAPLAQAPAPAPVQAAPAVATLAVSVPVTAAHAI
ncbi:uncharacterized protein RCO7_08183 [Rhynchosporium graminicola]|uniref:Extracellular serine-rich protein n=1 Tax=Rhynchosporium graminicola TaxID=2792576 RepID=A0A1E1LD90_9HELO|nr:uncharacterized protein RCO7_08183 [Rhynchosporium commune]